MTFCFSALVLSSTLFSQTNVQGTINTNTTWGISGSPYKVVAAVTVRDGATLTIEQGAEVQFSTSSIITIGYSTSSRGNLVANGAKFRGLLSADGRIYFKSGSASAQLVNCTFDNAYLSIENSEITVTNCTFDNCVYPVSLEDGGTIVQSGLVFGSNNANYGIQVKGTVKTKYVLPNINIPYFVDNLVVRDSATLTISSGVEVYFPTTTGITCGYSATSPGTLTASNVHFKGTTSSDSRIHFADASGSGTIDNCVFDNAYLLIENSTATVQNCTFLKCSYPIVLQDGAKANLTNLQFDSNVLYPGIGVQGTIKNTYALRKISFPYYISGLTVNNNSSLTIDNGVPVLFPTTSGIVCGSSATSKGDLIATGVSFTGLSTSDAQTQIKYNSQSQITSCVFTNAYLNIDNASPQIKNTRFTGCTYAIATRNNASPTIVSNDFYNNTYALYNYGTNTITARANFWGDPSGPVNSGNPTGKGDKIEGTVDFGSFQQTPFNGSIVPTVLINRLDFGEQVIGTSTELTFKVLASSGSIDVLVSNLETDNAAYVITSPTRYWLTKKDTPTVKINFTPQGRSLYAGKLKIYTNQQGSSPLSIDLAGKGVSTLAANPSSIDFGLVNLSSSKSLTLEITNRGKKTVTIDSMKSSNAKFAFVESSAGSSSQAYDETAVVLSSALDPRNETAAAFYLYAGKSKTYTVVYKPTTRAVEAGFLVIYHGTEADSLQLSGQGYASPLSTTISSLNYQSFPYLFLNASVDTFNVGISTLRATNFEIYENGQRQLNNVNVLPPGQGGGSRAADIVFIMDNSGSMSDEQAAVATNVKDFVTQLAGSGIDYALGLCRYGSSTSSGNPIIEENGILTSNADYFKSSVWTKNVANGGKEPGYYAIKQAASSFAFRPGAQKIFIIITDENPNQGGSTLDEAQAICVQNSTTLFALTNSGLYSAFTPITYSTNGSIYDIHSDFKQILAYISTTISQNYLIQYKSSDPLANNSLREVVLRVSYGSNTASDTVTFNPGSIPKIQRTDSTLALHSKAWIDGTTFRIQVSATDDIEPFVQRVALYYRPSNQMSFISATMVSQGQDKYYAVIPGTAVHAPGVDYYITASDGSITTSDPKLTPALNPYQIAVLPNFAPKITHTIVENATRHANVQVDAIVTDSTNKVAEVKLYYRAVGQLSYQSAVMAVVAANAYRSSIPWVDLFNDGIEYYIMATDDFGVSTFHGSPSSPHSVSIVAVSVAAQLDTLAKGPSIKTVEVPSNGTGYCYFRLSANSKPVFSRSTVKAMLTSGGTTIPVEGMFLSPGVFRLDLSHEQILDSTGNYTLGAGISVSDTFYTFNSSPYVLTINRIPSPFERTWTVFAGGSAGVSGTAGSIGLGVSAAAAKLSIKGSAGAGLGITLDQDNNLFLDRRLEIGVATEVSVPNANLAVASATVATTSSSIKQYFGQQYSFTGLGLDADKVKMAQSGFLLETMSLAGIGLSPAVGAALSAIIETINATAGMFPIFNQGYVKSYGGLGIEGGLGVGFKAEVEGFELNALNPSLKVAVNFNLNQFSTTHPSNQDHTYASAEVVQAFNFNFSALDFGLKANDNVSLSGGNFSVFDAGLGASIGVEAKSTSSLAFNGLSLTLKGGGGLNLFNSQRDIYYTTSIDFPKEFASALTSSGSSLMGLFTKSKGIPLGTDILNDAVQTLKSSYSKITSVPINITTSEIRGTGYELDLGIDLDLALGLGLGVSFGINGKYYDEITYPRKVSDVYLNGDNYLIYTNNYSDAMKGAQFTEVLRDLFSGVLPLVKQSLLNIFNTLDKIVVAGKEFVLSVVSTTGDVLGEISGVASDAGSWVVTTFTSNLPYLSQDRPFTDPVFTKGYRSRNVLHLMNRGTPPVLLSTESNLVIFSRIMNVAFKKTGQTAVQDTIASFVQMKMIIYPQELAKCNFSMDDSAKIRLYYYDKNLLNWVYLGGELKGNTIVASINRSGSYALGIELTSLLDTEPPQIDEYGPRQGSIFSTYPLLYAVVHDNKYGSGIDLANSSISINGKKVDHSFDPMNSKMFYQATAKDVTNLATNRVEIVVVDLAGNQTKVNYEFRANITGIEEDQHTPDKFELFQNYPNPFNPSTQIRFSLAKHSQVEINIYDVRGILISKICKGEFEAGVHTVEWDGTNSLGYKVASGVYFYQLKTDEFNVVKKMEMIR
jgi:hypothetical protein